jgi:cell wall-associated NlpC family hydrolase
MYAICLLDIVPIRREASDKSEQVSQLRFGEIFEVKEVSENKKWSKISTYFDNYEGWVDSLQVYEISKEYFEAYQKNINKHKIVSNIQASCYELDTKKNIVDAVHLSKGAVLPFFWIKEDKKNHLKPRNKTFFEVDSKTFWYKGNVFDSTEISTQTLISRALAYKNIPYLWGGRSFFGADCSGFVQEVFKSFSKFIPRDAYQQAEVGELISDFKNIQTGDLVFFQRENRVIHVGIAWFQKKSLKIIHARGKVRVDMLRPEGIWDAERAEYSHYLHSIRRIF